MIFKKIGKIEIFLVQPAVSLLLIRKPYGLVINNIYN